MKKRYMILMVLAAFILAVPVLLMAGADHKVITVAQAKELEDDAKVVLEGFIIEDLGDEMYLFRDATGDINLKIDEDAWKKCKMDPEMLVRVYGEIDREDDSLKVEVKKIKDAKVKIEEDFEEEIVE
ncbi:MAG: NirD/YgiW/YdeI family stress tolerance protein [Phycisphaerae bacterium]|nr:NirD/YgiW/YdeI family stress tolerance protein [Phycisphaerae bacterium]